MRGRGLGIWLGIAMLFPAAMAGQTPAGMPAPIPAAPVPAAVEIIRRATKASDAADRALEHYTWLERDRQYELQPHGRPAKLVSDKTYWVSQAEGVQYRSWVGEDGHALSPSQQAKQAKKWAAFLKKMRRESPVERLRATAKLRRQRRRMERIRALVPQAFVLQLRGEEATPAGSCFIVTGTPRPGFRPQGKILKLLTHFSGRLWIDAQTYALVRARLTILRPVGLDWFLARIGSAGVLTMDYAPVDGHWFPRQLTGTVSARLLWVKSFHIRLQQDYFRYRRMRVTTRVIPVQPRR